MPRRDSKRSPKRTTCCQMRKSESSTTSSAPTGRRRSRRASSRAPAAGRAAGSAPSRAVPLHTALRGGEVSAPTLKGGQVQFKVPAETQNGTKIRLRGLGLPDPKSGPAGDMYAEVKVQLPLPMDERTRKWASEQPLS